MELTNCTSSNVKELYFEMNNDITFKKFLNKNNININDILLDIDNAISKYFYNENNNIINEWKNKS